MDYHNENITIEDILNEMPTLSKSSEDLIRKAGKYSKKMHEGQTRYSGIPYYTHTFSVGKLLAEAGMASSVVVAGILHDTLEDTEATAEDIKKEFGADVAFFVDSVSHLGDVRYKGLEIRVRSLQKLFIATSKDLRVIIIKLMDRLHNMQTLDAVPKEKQERIAKETLFIYIPLADRLGMGKLKADLEDLAFSKLEEEKFNTLKKDIDKIANAVSLDEVKKDLEQELNKKGIYNFRIESRIKTVYSTDRKMNVKGLRVEEVQDIIALRVVVNNISDVYLSLGAILARWDHIVAKFKDYIAFPKPNGYKAVHTRIDYEGKIIEVQILTEAMLEENLYGIANYFKVKDGRGGSVGLDLKWFYKILPQKDPDVPWVQKLAELQKDTVDAELFLDNIQSDFLQERMFVFTPKEEVVDLPRGATVIDFAFSIHTDIGLRAEGAFVNGKFTSIKEVLRNGDRVEIKIGKKENANVKWLEHIKTAEAKHKVQAFINRQA